MCCLSHFSYDYSNRQGILPVSWEDFHGLCKALALAAARFQPEIILPVGRGGYYPGTLIAHLLQVEPYPVRLSRRVRDEVVWDIPHWLVEPPVLVSGKRVLIVDEICSHGETLRMVAQKTSEAGAAEIRTAVLYAHTWGAQLSDYVGIITDSLILNPWDREVLCAGEFIFHPEYADALEKQGITPLNMLRIPARQFTLAKG